MKLEGGLTKQVKEKFESARLAFFLTIFDERAVVEPLQRFRALDEIFGAFDAVLKLAAVHSEWQICK